jgi:2-oxo-3-(phosphooxy)propyl 3-oxoalkanoate synthase
MTATTAALDTALSELDFREPVDCVEVHKRAAAEVLITDSAAVDSTRFLSAARLPHRHPTYVPTGARYHDLLLLLETVRQATIVVGHRHLGVPRDRQFLLRQVELSVHDLEACRRSAAPAQAVVDVCVSEVRRLDGVVAGFELRGRVSIDGVAAARGAGACLCLAVKDYRVVRGQAAVACSADLREPVQRPRARAAEVARAVQAEVMVAPIDRSRTDSVCAEIVVDPSHPTFFDHPQDHVPGTLLLEGARQVAQAALGGHALAVGARARFIAFAELDRSVTCKAKLTSRGARPAELATVAVEVCQGAAAVAAFSFDLRWPDA